MPRVAPLPLSPELNDLAELFGKSLGFVPNSVLIMQRKPKLARTFTALTAGESLRFGIDEKKLAAVWEYRTSPLYTEAERVALDFSVEAAAQPNAVTDASFAKLKRHWSDGQIVEIVGVIALFGFLNRWNDTMATPLEEEPIEIGTKYLAAHGWRVGKHRA